MKPWRFGHEKNNMKNNNFSKISDILNESVLTNQKFGQAFDKCMLFDFWKTVVGKRFEKFSIPYDLKGTVLFVSAQSPAIIQELSFYKADIIKKYTPYAQGLNFKITDIRFDYKNWGNIKKSKQKSDAFDVDNPDIYTEDDFEAVILDDTEEIEFNELQKKISNIDFLSDSLKEKIYTNARNSYKAQKLRKDWKK